MILQSLWSDADEILKQTRGEALPPPMYMPKRVRWILELSHDPRLEAKFIPTPGADKKGTERLIPFIKRAYGISPILLADKPAYTFGIKIADAKRDAGRDLDKDAARTVLEHQAYKALVRACANQIGDPDVAHIADYLERWDPQNPLIPIPPEMGRDDLITFSVDDNQPIQNVKVQEFWAKAAAGEGTGEEEAELKAGIPAREAMQCLVSGVVGPVEEMMPVPVKGLPGGKSEMAIVSANASAFESYGLPRAKTSPISRDAAERFGQALNALLASENHRARGGSVTYVFWARGGVVPLPAFNPPTDPRDLEKFITAAECGDTSWVGEGNLPPDEKFHIFGLTANAARVVVRSALDTTIGEIGKRQADWFTRLALTGSDGQPGKALPLRTLAVAAFREFKDIAPDVEDALTLAALAGPIEHPLPNSLLNSLVMRSRLDTDNRVTYPRAALIKYILTQHRPLEEAQRMTHETADVLPEGFTASEANAYHLGRLFCELENIQYVALNKPNTTISDRFYGAASTAPASAFGTLLSGVKNHLSKMRREGGKSAGNAQFAQKRLDLIMAWITDYPKTLTLREQALFGLGYYQYRAARRRDVSEASVAKQRAALFAAGDPAALVTDEDND